MNTVKHVSEKKNKTKNVLTAVNIRYISRSRRRRFEAFTTDAKIIRLIFLDASPSLFPTAAAAR